MALTSGPRVSQISCPVPSSVAMVTNRIGMSSTRVSPRSRSSSRRRRSPPIRPEPLMWKSSRPITRRRVSERVNASSSSSLPITVQPPTTAPTELPAMTSGTMPSRCSTRITPMCAQPRAAPPPSASPSFSLPFADRSAGGASSMSEPASPKARRARSSHIMARVSWFCRR